MLLSKEEKKSVLIGMNLGDGCLHLGKKARNYNITCTHNPKQYDYLIWKMELLKENLGKNYWISEKKSHFSGKAIHNGNINKEYIMYQASLGSHPMVTQLHKEMYDVNNKKIVTKNILQQLTPIGIAIWFMDDGCLSYKKNKDGSICSREITLHIQGFDDESQENIKNFFKERYNIDSKLHKDRNHKRLWMNTTNAKKFLEIVEQYVKLVPCMNYKTDMKYKNSI